MPDIIVCQDASHYAEIRNKIDVYERACRDKYGPGRRAFTHNEIVAVGKPYPTNEERSAVETWEFQHGESDRCFVYVNLNDRVVTTWTGQVLGRITDVGREWTDNFGGRRVPLTVLGINSVMYHGTYYKSAGDYVRLKAKRHKGSLVVQSA